MLTYYDALRHCAAHFGGGDEQLARDDSFWAVEQAYYDLAYGHGRQWQYFRRYEALVLSPVYRTGTISYTHTGGAYERVVTLTGGTWPSDAALGTIRIAGKNHDVDVRKSDTQITLSQADNPGANVASGTSYEWFRDVYQLSETFETELTPPTDTDGRELCLVDLERWNYMRHSAYGSGSPTHFAIGRDPDDYARKALRVWPAPASADRLILFGYHRPRPVSVSGLDTADTAGTISIAAGSVAVSGSGSSFDANLHKGSVLRIGRDGNSQPLGYWSRVRPLCDRIIMDVSSSTSLTIGSAVPKAVSQVKYLISDPLDIHPSMYGLFFATLDLKLAERTRKSADEIANYQRLYLRERVAAFEADAMVKAEFILSPARMHLPINETISTPVIFNGT